MVGLLAIFGSLPAQNRGAAPATNAPLETAICLWPVAGMRAAPGKQAQYVEPIYFGQELRLLGDSAYVNADGKMYDKAVSESGNIGWVHRYLFDKNASSVVVMTHSPIYASPGSATSISTSSFEKGEIAAMGDFHDDWIYLVGKERDKKGWIKRVGNVEPISIDNSDLTVASLLDKANGKDNVRDRIAALEAIRRQPGFDQSPLKDVVLKEVENNVLLASQSAAEERTRDMGNQSPNGTPGTTTAQTQRTRSLDQPEQVINALSGGNYFEEKVYDANTGQNYTKVTEKGGIFPVKGPENAKSIYYGYHKTLPKGTRVLLNIPDNPGFVEIEIINRLSDSRPQVIGLSVPCIEALFGNDYKSVEAEIIYFVKE